MNAAKYAEIFAEIGSIAVNRRERLGQMNVSREGVLLEIARKASDIASKGDSAVADLLISVLEYAYLDSLGISTAVEKQLQQMDKECR